MSICKRKFSNFELYSARKTTLFFFLILFFVDKLFISSKFAECCEAGFCAEDTGKPCLLVYINGGEARASIKTGQYQF